MFKLSKKIALPLIAVLLIGTGVGGYFLFRNFQIPKYFVDRYPELLEYCDVQEGEDTLRVSCKALMLDIKPNVSEGVPSLTSLIITKSEELKEYTIAEEEAKFAFTNDILQFKKLKPVIINIQYTKINPIKYAVQGITFEDIPQTYIQEIVNRDIEEIMGIDKNSTTILNSFDFCPRPEILPDYVIKKDEYAKYWEENILPKEEYLNGYNYSLDDTTIRLLFACDSAKNVGYTDVCEINNTTLIFSNLFSENYKALFSMKNITETDLLKEISALYDKLHGIESTIEVNQGALLTIICNKQINNVKPCNNGNISFFQESDNISENDSEGNYLSTFFSTYKNQLFIFYRCSNLSIKLLSFK